MQSPDSTINAEPFPAIDRAASSGLAQSPSADGSRDATVNRPAASSSLSGRLRRASQSFGQSGPPEGFFAAAGGIASSILSRQAGPRPVSSSVGCSSVQAPQTPQPGDLFLQPSRVQSVPEDGGQEAKGAGSSASQTQSKPSGEPRTAAPFPNGYHFPPKHTFGQSLKQGSLAFWNYFLTPLGFLVTIYGLNVVAWGGMLFLLLCEAAPAMCHPTCSDINSARRIWIEIDSQILNALFCVTGFGLAPWRFRDLYFLLQYRMQGKFQALRRLAAIHRGWFRLEGSAELPVDLGPRNLDTESGQAVPRSSIPFPEEKIPDAPLTGVRARATKVWRMDLVIWLMVWNTFFQCCLAGFMWGMNRYDRPGWTTGLFVGLACVVAGIGGLIMFLEGKQVKSIEGVPVSQKDLEQLERDREHGIWHYNNLKDKELDAKGKSVKK